MTLDYIVVGQGLAGSVLSYYLIKHGLKVLVVDDQSRPKASMVAAGIFNPFTGRNLVKTWNADQLFGCLPDFYRGIEEDLHINVLHQLPMYRPFLSHKEQNEWGARLYEAGFNQYIDYILSPQQALPQVVNPMGGMMLKQTGYVDLHVLVREITSYLIEANALLPESFSFKDLQIDPSQVSYKGHNARRIIFCDGPSLIENPFFNWLPLRPVKGEILEVEFDQVLSIMVNRGVFVLPLSNGRARVGSTFDQQDLSWTSTTSARTSIVRKLDKLISLRYQIKHQFAGIRPATLDRRPLVGMHPEFEPLGVFNGLGTKGVSLVPYLTREFFEFLEHKKPLSKDITISRYFSLYYNKI